MADPGGETTVARYFQAVALDFDGTVSSDGQRPAPEVIESLHRARALGYHLILVTGRILSHLRSDFPDLDQHFDMIVAENGALLARDQDTRLLCEPVDLELVDALRRRGVQLRQGEALVDCFVRDAIIAGEEIRRLGLDNQLVYNRDALMIMPAGVTKGTGLAEALAELGISHHSTIGVGDAENDHSLLNDCEIGVAVSNAVPALKLHADRILDHPAGEGVCELLDGPLLAGTPAHSHRRQLQLGTTQNRPRQDTHRSDQAHRRTDSHSTGQPITVPSSQLNVLICGSSGSGKSYLAGMFAEGLISLGYSVLIVDPEGDHLALAWMRNTIRLSSTDGLPSPEVVMQLMRERLTSVVLDVSEMSGHERERYLSELSLQIAVQRHAYGLPHWVFVDEAQDAPKKLNPSARIPIQSNWGYCLVSWRPEGIDDETIDQIDIVIAAANRQAEPYDETIVDAVTRVCGHDSEGIRDQLNNLAPGQALLARRQSEDPPQVFSVASRLTGHVRHWHKYIATKLPPDQWFYFRDNRDRSCGTAANLTELHVALSGCSDGVLRHHAGGNEISRWIRAVFQDNELSDELVVVEDELAANSVSVAVARMGLLSAIRRRYGL